MRTYYRRVSVQTPETWPSALYGWMDRVAQQGIGVNAFYAPSVNQITVYLDPDPSNPKIHWDISAAQRNLEGECRVELGFQEVSIEIIIHKSIQHGLSRALFPDVNKVGY